MKKKDADKKRKELIKKYHKELKEKATKSEKQFLSLIRKVKREYNLKFTVVFQKPWISSTKFYFSDFYFPLSKITVELDGLSHYHPLQQKQDMEKEAYLLSLCIRTVRLQNSDVYVMDSAKLFTFLMKNGII